MKKIIFFAYFIGLFLLISSYVAFSQLDTSLRMSIATAESFAPDHVNYIRVIVRDLETGAKFDGYDLTTCWRYSTQDISAPNDLCSPSKLPENGIATVEVPPPPSVRPNALCVSLHQNGDEKKSTCIDASSLQFDSATNREIERDIVLNDAYKIHNHKNDAEQNTNSHQPIAQNAQADDSSPNAPNAPNPGIPQAPNAPNPGIPQDPAMIAPAPNADRGDYNVVVPGAFLSGAPNEIFIQTMQSGEPITSPIEVRQIYGQPIAFETPLTPSPAGIARFSLTLDSAADFEFIQDAHSFYASFSANDKPLHISSAALITEAHSARVTVTPFGNADRVVTDVFDGQAWIAHREDALPNNRTLVISRERLNYDVPKILYFRFSTSLFTNVDASQTAAIIVAPGEISTARQAKIALDEAIYAGYTQLVPYLSRLDSLHATAHAGVRDLALAYLAMAHDSEITLKKRTEIDERADFDELKKKQKSIANIIFVVWFALGAFIFIALAVSHARERRNALGAADSAATTKRALQIALLVVLLIILAGSLYYMMQIV